ncbi:MAG: hypothetical protein M0P30_07430 [Syntrophorhabdaceae bacterium]|nr:hypothetical protein [Syntrophorhabdaceae bacterium]
MALFITDLGETMECRKEDGAVEIIVPRYGVWVYDAGKGKPQVVEASDDLEYLKTKYGVTDDRITRFTMQKENEGPGSAPTP